MAKEEIQSMRKELELLRSWKQGIETCQKSVSFNPKRERKIRRFDGDSRDIAEWTEDALISVEGLQDQEAVSFLLQNLGGEARQELRLHQAKEKDTAVKIIHILQDAFGTGKTDVSLKQTLYQRHQRPRESLREFTRSISEIASQVRGVNDQAKDSLLIEVLLHNARDGYVKSELRKRIREKPDTSFVQLREFALWLSADDFDQPTNVRRQEAVQTKDLEQLTDRLDQLESRHTEICQVLQKTSSLLESFQHHPHPPPQPTTRPSYHPISLSPQAPPFHPGSQYRFPRSSGRQNAPQNRRQCYSCGSMDHLMRNCPNKPPPQTPQSGNSSGLQLGVTNWRPQ